MLEQFLEKLEVTLTERYGKDWTYNFDIKDDGWIDVSLQIPADCTDEDCRVAGKHTAWADKDARIKGE